MAKDTIKRLRSKADKLFALACIKQHGNMCELCGNSYQLQVHHFFPKGNFGHLRYNLSNGIVLCKSCHFVLHNKDISLEAEIMRVRGDEWYVDLKEKAKERPISYIKVSWYKENIEILEKYLED